MTDLRILLEQLVARRVQFAWLFQSGNELIDHQTVGQGELDSGDPPQTRTPVQDQRIPPQELL
jgi:hypothetical protein